MSHQVSSKPAELQTLAAANIGQPLTHTTTWPRNLLLTIPFLFLLWANIAHHQLWLDELNAWGLSAASPTLKTLLANVRYEGHPWLWYFILWIPAQFTHNPVALKWVAALIGTATYLVIGMLSPFSRLEKVLFFLCYFVSFEYTVLSRTYCPMLLLALFYTWRRTSRPQAPLENLLLLGALANTDLTGIMLSGSLLLEYAFCLLIHRKDAETLVTRRALLAASAAYLALLGISVLTLWPAHDISWDTTGHLFAKATSLARFGHALTDVTVAPWWPILRHWPHEFWNTDVDFNHTQVLCIPFVLAGYYWCFRRNRSLLVLMGSVLLCALGFAHLVYIGYPRHWGITVAGFLVALWMLRAETTPTRRLPRIAYCLLFIAALKGVASIAASWTHPFSETANVAAWIRHEHYDSLPLAGSSDFNVAGVAEQLQKPVYFLNCNCVDTYMKFAHRRDDMQQGDIPARVVVAARTLQVPEFLLVEDAPLKPNAVRSMAEQGVVVQHLQDFSGSEDHFGFYTYLAKMKQQK